MFVSKAINLPKLYKLNNQLKQLAAMQVFVWAILKISLIRQMVILIQYLPHMVKVNFFTT